MTTEYTCLTIMTLFFMFAWAPISVGKFQAFGGRWLASNRKPLPGKELAPWAARCERAYNNLKDYFPAYVVAILVLGAQNKFDQGTSYAAMIFLMARVGHYISYGLGNVPARFGFFTTSLVANLYLLIKIFI
mgnify:CR=1 FL=1